VTAQPTRRLGARAMPAFLADGRLLCERLGFVNIEHVHPWMPSQYVT
jgi:hypothetical protein